MPRKKRPPFPKPLWAFFPKDKLVHYFVKDLWRSDALTNDDREWIIAQAPCKPLAGILESMGAMQSLIEHYKWEVETTQKEYIDMVANWPTTKSRWDQ